MILQLVYVMCSGLYLLPPSPVLPPAPVTAAWFSVFVSLFLFAVVMLLFYFLDSAHK